MFDIEEFRQYMKSKFSWAYRAHQKRYRALKKTYSALIEYPTALSYQANEEVLKIIRKEMKEVRQLIFDVRLHHNDVFFMTLKNIQDDLKSKVILLARSYNKNGFAMLHDACMHCSNSRENTTLCMYTKLIRTV